MPHILTALVQNTSIIHNVHIHHNVHNNHNVHIHGAHASAELILYDACEHHNKQPLALTIVLPGHSRVARWVMTTRRRTHGPCCRSDPSRTTIVLPLNTSKPYNPDSLSNFMLKFAGLIVVTLLLKNFNACKKYLKSGKLHT